MSAAAVLQLYVLEAPPKIMTASACMADEVTVTWHCYILSPREFHSCKIWLLEHRSAHTFQLAHTNALRHALCSTRSITGCIKATTQPAQSLPDLIPDKQLDMASICLMRASFNPTDARWLSLEQFGKI